jgi:hypothetical protein
MFSLTWNLGRGKITKVEGGLLEKRKGMREGKWDNGRGM